MENIQGVVGIQVWSLEGIRRFGVQWELRKSTNGCLHTLEKEYPQDAQFTELNAGRRVCRKRW
jgi:hypothetical protein